MSSDRERRRESDDTRAATSSPTERDAAEGDRIDAETFDEAALAADLRELVTAIEAIHPEPYRGYDGRVAMHEALESTVRNLPGVATREECYRLAAPLVAGLDDAHSRVVPPDGDASDDTRLPVALRVVGDAIYVAAVFDESLSALLGSRVLSVEETTVETMADRITDLRGAENRYFERLLVSNRIESNRWFDRLCDGTPTAADRTLRVRTGDGQTVRRTLSPIEADSNPVATLDRTADVPAGSGPRYRLTDDRRVAVFVPGNLTYYREVVQAARDRGADYAAAVARDAYAFHTDETPPDDLDDCIPALPSMVETLTALVRAMDDADSTSLVVDLRDNPGGDSRYVEYLAYVLFGLDRLVAERDWTVELKRRTAPHRDRYGVPDGARDEYATFEANPAGYDFGPRFRAAEAGADARRASLVDRLSVGAFADELDDRVHDGYYEPDRIVVATTAGTMSSGFAGAALLSEFGADVVGVPPGQAPRSFGEAVETTLSNTGLPVEIAGSMYRWTRSPTAAVLPTARELTPTLFEERYDRAGDAVLQLALDRVRELR